MNFFQTLLTDFWEFTHFLQFPYSIRDALSKSKDNALIS